MLKMLKLRLVEVITEVVGFEGGFEGRERVQFPKLCGSVFRRAGAQIEKLRSPYLLSKRGTSSLLQSLPERKAGPPTCFEYMLRCLAHSWDKL